MVKDSVTKQDLECIFRNYTDDVPLCGESMFQCDRYAENALYVLDDLCKILGIYKN